MVAGTFVLSRLCAGHFHLREIRVSPRSFARGGALRCRAIAAKDPDLHSEPDFAGCGGTPPTGQFRWSQVEILLRHPGQAGSAHLPAIRKSRRTPFRAIQKISWRPDASRVWLRRLPRNTGAKTTPQDH